MEKHDNPKDLIVQWINETLTDEEKKAFEKTEDFKNYKTILKGTDLLEVPTYKKDDLFNKTQKNKLKTSKYIYSFPKWTYMAAASVALLIGYIFFNNQTANYSTNFGEQIAISLPDESEVILNAKSELSYKKRNWIEQRNLNLKGEAYFKVNNGSTFTVKTDNGVVTVLGTQFTINTTGNIFEVICYEGKVKISKDSFSKVITKGEAVRAINESLEEWNINTKSPSWIQKESSFTNAPLIQIIKAIENQYDVDINSDKINTQIRYTGSFTHTDLRKALQTVFAPLKIKFTFIDEKNVTLSNK